MKNNPYEEIKVLKQRIRSLEEGIGFQTNQRHSIDEDRARYRKYVVTQLKNLAECADSGSTPSVQWQILQISRLLNDVEKFPW